MKLVAMMALTGLLLSAESAGARPAAWAIPVEKPGLPNLHRVTDWLYRGAQPTAEGMFELERMGIRTIVDLRAYHSDARSLRGTKLSLVWIPVHTGDPTLDQVARFLDVIRDPARRPIFVHCQHGADRTGLMMAMYRIATLGWTKEQAIAEMRDGGYGFHTIWQNLVAFILKADLAALTTPATPRID